MHENHMEGKFTVKCNAYDLESWGFLGLQNGALDDVWRTCETFWVVQRAI